MAEPDLKYALYGVIGIVTISILLFSYLSTTGNILSGPDTCNQYGDQSACQGNGCIWGSSTCYSFGRAPPVIIIPIDRCAGLTFFQCVMTQGCSWSWLTGKCVSGGISVFNPCQNGVKDAGESDVDCGGLKCIPCAAGKNCAVNKDCQSDFCSNLASIYYNGGQATFKCTACAGGSGSDNLQNCGETGIDCGGGNALYPCSCYNGKLDTGENATDCNFPTSPIKICEPCTILSGSWYPSHCFDKRPDYGEACGDCGGSCSNARGNAPRCCSDPASCRLNGGGFWCNDKTVCIDQKTPDCFLSSSTCTAAGYFWCKEKVQCMGLKHPECFSDSSTCTAAGYGWCNDTHEFICENKPMPTYCYTNKNGCEGDGYKWCTGDSTCTDQMSPSCYINKASCEGASFFWCANTNNCYGDIEGLAENCFLNKADCEGAGYLWCAHFNICTTIKAAFCSNCLFNKADCESASCIWTPGNAGGCSAP